MDPHLNETMNRKQREERMRMESGHWNTRTIICRQMGVRVLVWQWILADQILVDDSSNNSTIDSFPFIRHQFTYLLHNNNENPQLQPFHPESWSYYPSILIDSILLSFKSIHSTPSTAPHPRSTWELLVYSIIIHPFPPSIIMGTHRTIDMQDEA